VLRICSPQLGLDPQANLGGAVYDRELLRAMTSLGAAVDVLLPAGAPVDTNVPWSVTRTPVHRRSYYEYNWIFWRALRQHWRERPADVLRVHSPYSVGPGALAFARTAHVPIVLHYLHREPRPLWTLIDRCSLHRYDLVVTISEATRTQLLAAGLRPDRIVMAYPGVADTYVPGPRPAPGGALRALYVGGLLPRKNLTLALGGIAAARTRGLDVTLDLAGAGEQAGALRAEVDQLGLTAYVRFLGRVDEREKLRLLQQADVFLFPSILEGFGMAAAEALACGLPVVGMRSTSTAEIVSDGRTGILLDDPGDRGAMAAALERLADPAERQRMADAAIRDVRARFSWRESARTVLAAYASVAKGRLPA
jgi:glycosyltransferase involved in cell wall biosynthesis